MVAAERIPTAILPTGRKNIFPGSGLTTRKELEKSLSSQGSGSAQPELSAEEISKVNCPTRRSGRRKTEFATRAQVVPIGIKSSDRWSKTLSQSPESSGASGTELKKKETEVFQQLCVQHGVER